jgi:hypothetical protein
MPFEKEIGLRKQYHQNNQRFDRDIRIHDYEKNQQFFQQKTPSHPVGIFFLPQDNETAPLDNLVQPFR